MSEVDSVTDTYNAELADAMDHVAGYSKLRPGERSGAQYHCIVLADEIARLRGERAWEPIETAPKTRHAILVHCPERHNTYIVAWHPGYEGHDSGWNHFGGFGRALNESPSHWIPLPEPPIRINSHE
jgi:hypothetical protein